MWVQEEPANMGALSYMLPRLKHIADDRPVHSVKRSGERESGDRLGEGA